MNEYEKQMKMREDGQRRAWKLFEEAVINAWIAPVNDK